MRITEILVIEMEQKDGRVDKPDENRVDQPLAHHTPFPQVDGRQFQLGLPDVAVQIGQNLFIVRVALLCDIIRKKERAILITRILSALGIFMRRVHY